MRPAHNPTRVVYKSESDDPAFKERRKVLSDFCNDVREKAQLIPYSDVKEGITRKISEYLTHPTTLFGDRWKDVMAKLGYADLCLQGKVKYHEQWDQTAFFLFLTKVYAKEDGSTLWKVIEALSEEKYTYVLENIKTEVFEFVGSYTTSVAVIQENPKCVSVPLDTMDSGVGQSLGSNGNPQSHSRGGNMNYLARVPSPTRNHDFLLSPQRGHVVLDYMESLKSKRQFSQENIFSPKREPVPNLSFFNDDDNNNLEFNSPFEKKSATGMNIIILHTDSDEDEEVVEKIAERLDNEHPGDFNTYLLKDMPAQLTLDAGQFVMNIMECMDFVVPAISRAYLQQIVPVGDTNEMPPNRLILRYLHAVSQTRVINKNSLNYLIRPIIVDADVNYGMVRRWHEFQSAVKYPKDLGRLAKNLKATKKLLIQNKYGRQ